MFFILINYVVNTLFMLDIVYGSWIVTKMFHVLF